MSVTAGVVVVAAVSSVVVVVVDALSDPELQAINIPDNANGNKNFFT